MITPSGHSDYRGSPTRLCHDYPDGIQTIPGGLREAVSCSTKCTNVKTTGYMCKVSILSTSDYTPRAGPGVERLGRTPPPLAQSVETWPIGVRLVCRELRPVSLEERILVIERVGCGRHATHYFGLNFS